MREGMAIFHCQIRPIQRSKRRSVIQLVSYVTGLKLRSLRTGRCYRRRTPGDVIRFACVGSNLPMQVLWQKAESAERRKNSIEGRHQIVALPRENSQEEQWKMLVAMAEAINRLMGVPVVVALHDNAGESDKPRNPHGHLVFATRAWNERAQSFLGKTRSIDVATTGSVIFELFRKTWEDIVNAGLPAGVPKVSRLSHARAGRNRIPRRHLGEQATAMERNGFRTHHGDFNRKVDRLDRVTAQRIKVESRLNPPPVLNYADRQRQLGLERELAIARVAIASVPPVRDAVPFGDNGSSHGVVQVNTAPGHAIIAETHTGDTAKHPQAPAPLSPHDSGSTPFNEVLERSSSAAELIPRPIEDEVSVALEAVAPMRSKDLSPP